jgi:3-hydroxy-9,10-secoandrosta-1,3,5(10)-triene-9,17-dione monooxygenase reductase component
VTTAERSDDAAVTGPDFRRFMRSWATGVVVVTGSLARRPAGCTVNSFTSVSLRPPLLLVSLSERSHTLAAITERATFGISVLGWEQRHLGERFAAPDDRFAGVRYRLENGVPLLDDAMATAVCTVERLIVAADHVLVLGRPQWCESAGDTDPVVFFNGRYQTVRVVPEPVAEPGTPRWRPRLR